MNWCSVVMNWCRVVMNWCSVVMIWCSAVMNWCSAVMNWCSAVMNWCSAVMNWCNVVMNWCSVVMNWCSAVMNRQHAFTLQIPVWSTSTHVKSFERFVDSKFSGEDIFQRSWIEGELRDSKDSTQRKRDETHPTIMQVPIRMFVIPSEVKPASDNKNEWINFSDARQPLITCFRVDSRHYGVFSLWKLTANQTTNCAQPCVSICWMLVLTVKAFEKEGNRK